MKLLNCSGIGMSNKAKVCRICMLGNIKGVISLFTLCDGTVKIYDKVMEVANIQISREDGLPTWICYTCLIHLETSFQFKMQAEKSDQLFKKQLDTTNNEDIKKMAIYTNEDPLQSRSHLRELLIEPKPSDKSLVGSDSINQDYFTNIQSGLQGHFLSEVFDVNDCSPVVNSEEQIGIKITSVVSQAEPEEIEIADCPTNAELVDTSDNDTQVVGTPGKESVCICAEDKDGIIISKCDVCTKIPSDRGTNGDVNNYINIKTYQNPEALGDDMVVSKACINRIIELIEKNEQFPKSCNAGKISASDSVYSCSKCGDRFGDSQFIVTLKEKTKKKFECHTCNKVFGFRNSLNTHLLTHTGDKPYKCHMCDYATFVNRNMIHHMLVHVGEKPFKCDMCAKAFIAKKQLNVHMQIHSNIKPHKCDQCEKTFVNQNGLRHHKLTHLDVKLRTKKKLTCTVCEYTSFVNRNLRRHMLIHADEKPFTCGVCAKAFVTEQNLNRHKETHSTVKPYKCDLCDKVFVNKERMRNHKVFHSDVLIYKCKYCDKGYKYKYLLKIHEEAHESPVKCEICFKEFKTRSGLTSHNQIHHSGMECKYVCEICGKSFIVLSRLKSHKTMHTDGKPMECDICNKKFPHKRALRVHKRLVHFKNKVDQCDICGKKFKHASSLKNHINTVHSDGQKYNCDICNATFTQKSALRTHTKIIHVGLEPHSCQLCGQTFKWKQTFDKHTLKCVGSQ